MGVQPFLSSPLSPLLILSTRSTSWKEFNTHEVSWSQCIPLQRSNPKPENSRREETGPVQMAMNHSQNELFKVDAQALHWTSTPTINEVKSHKPLLPQKRFEHSSGGDLNPTREWLLHRADLR